MNRAILCAILLALLVNLVDRRATNAQLDRIELELIRGCGK